MFANQYAETGCVKEKESERGNLAVHGSHTYSKIFSVQCSESEDWSSKNSMLKKDKSNMLSSTICEFGLSFIYVLL